MRVLFIPTQCSVLSQYYCCYCHDWCHRYFNMWRNNAWCLVFKSKCKIEQEQIELWADTYLLIIDEISFASKSDFKMMHKQLGKLKQEINEKFSGLNIIFSGDFWQFKPVGRGKLPLYKDDCPYFIDWVNCYILPLVQNSGYTFFLQSVDW